MTKKQKAHLLEPQSTGGATAEGGFRFQDHLIVCRFPAWLKAAGFSTMIREGMGDTEARFFVPGLGSKIEFIEYKSYELTAAAFWDEIDRFAQMDKDHLGIYNRFILVCTGVAANLRPLVNDLSRLRSTFPFYDDAVSIQNASFADFVATVKTHKRGEETARFLFEKVLLDTDPQKNVAQALASFRGELEKHFPIFGQLPAPPAEAAWRKLVQLSSERRATPISRQELEDALWSDVAVTQRPHTASTELHTANEPDPAGWEPDKKVIFRWDAFSGGEGRNFPPAEVWMKDVVGQLAETRDWIVTSGRSKKIELTGQRRLSASAAIGAIFCAVQGFDIIVQIRDQQWATSAHADAGTPSYDWRSQTGLEKAPEIAVSIGLNRDPEPEVIAYLASNGLKLPLCSLFSDAPLTSAQQVNLAVRNAKKIIDEAIKASGAKKIHLFMAVPAQLALFLGHRMNATVSIQCYERVETGVYRPTCLIGGA